MSLESGGDDAEKVAEGHPIPSLFAHGYTCCIEIFSLETGGPLGFFFPPFDRDKGPENYVVITQV